MYYTKCIVCKNIHESYGKKFIINIINISKFLNSLHNIIYNSIHGHRHHPFAISAMFIFVHQTIYFLWYINYISIISIFQLIKILTYIDRFVK